MSPAVGPACPFVYGMGLAFNVAAGVVMSITGPASSPEALQPLGVPLKGLEESH